MMQEEDERASGAPPLQYDDRRIGDMVPDLTMVSMEDIWGGGGGDDDGLHMPVLSPVSSATTSITPARIHLYSHASNSPITMPTYSSLAPLFDGLLSLPSSPNDAVLDDLDPFPTNELALSLSTSSSSSSSSSSMDLSHSFLPLMATASSPKAGGAGAGGIGGGEGGGGGGGGGGDNVKQPSRKGAVGGTAVARPSSSVASIEKQPSSSSSLSGGQAAANRRRGPTTLEAAGGGSNGASGGGGGSSKRSFSSRQKADSYERKKTRAKLCRRVLKERFDCLLRTLGDPSLRKSDKCGLLTGAIDLIGTLRQQLHGTNTTTTSSSSSGGGGSSGPYRTTIPSSTTQRSLSLGPFLLPPARTSAFSGGGRSSGGSPVGPPLLRRSTRNAAGKHKYIKSEAGDHDSSSSDTDEDDDHDRRHSGDDDEEDYEGEEEDEEDSDDDGEEGEREEGGRRMMTGLGKRRAGTPAHRHHQQQQGKGMLLHGFNRLWSSTPSGGLPPVLLIATFLDPTCLEASRAVERRWYDTSSRDGLWRDLCAKRWCVSGVQLEELWSKADQPATWREVYVRLHRALLAPAASCFPSCWLHQQQSVVLGRGHSSKAGVTAWLSPVSYLGQTVRTLPQACVPSLRGAVAGGVNAVAVLLPLRLTLQNTSGSAAVLLPYQPFAIRAIRAYTNSSSIINGKARITASVSATTTTTSGPDPFFREVEAWQLREAGLDPEAYLSKVVSWNGDRLTGHDRVPWALYQGVGGMRLGLFDSVVISLWVVAPGCMSWADLAVRVSTMTVEVMAKAHNNTNNSNHHSSSSLHNDQTSVTSHLEEGEQVKSEQEERVVVGNAMAVGRDDGYGDSDGEEGDDDEEGGEETRLGLMARARVTIVMGHTG